MALVLLTGGTGFIGSRTLRYALEHGYKVRAAVRSQTKAKALSDSLPQFSETLTTVLVPDILAPGAYDEAVSGVDFVVHIASPLAIGTLEDDLNAKIIQPAVQGTVEILRASLKEPAVKRVVITSSTIAIVPFMAVIGAQQAGDRVFTSADRLKDIEPPYPAVFAAYAQSKIASLRAAEEWMDRTKPSFDLVTIHPAFVGGRNDTANKASDLLDGTNPYFLAPVLGKEASKKAGANMANVVDVDDVAKAHIESLNKRIPGNKAYLLVNKGGDMAWNDAKTIVQKHFPNAVGRQLPNDGSIEPHFFLHHDIEETEKLFGPLKSFEDTITGLVDQYLSLLAKESR
jgi:nucleoside-diphosphate-sugar epimerase